MSDVGPTATAVPTVATLSSQLRRGAVVAALGLVVVQAVTIVQTLVLARLLGPEEVGIFAAGTIMMAFLTLFVQSSLTQALIQREHDLEHAATTVFWVTAATGLAMCLLTVAVSPLIGEIFHSSKVAAIAAVSAGTLLLHSLSGVPDALMQRAFQFKRRIIIDPAVGITFAAVAIAFGALGFGAWAMVIGSYASLVVSMVGSWWLSKWRLGKGRFSFRLWREMAGFAWPLLVEGSAERARDTAEVVLVGRGLDTAALGNYRYGRRIAMLPSIAIVQVCSYVLFPAFARIAGDPARLKHAFLRALRWIWLATVPVTALTVALGESGVVLLLGEPWRGAGVALAAMAGLGLGSAMNSVTAESMKGSGRSDRLLWMSGVGLCVGLPLFVLLMRLGLVGISLAVSISSVAAGITGLHLARSVIGVSIKEIAGCLVPPLVAALVGFAVIAPLERLIVHADDRTTTVGLVLIALESLGFLLVFAIALRIVGPGMFAEVTAAVRARVNGLVARRSAGRSPEPSASSTAAAGRK